MGLGGPHFTGVPISRLHRFEIFMIHFNPLHWRCMHDCSALTSTADLCFAWQGIQPTVLQLILRYLFSRDLQYTNAPELISLHKTQHKYMWVAKLMIHAHIAIYTETLRPGATGRSVLED